MAKPPVDIATRAAAVTSGKPTKETLDAIASIYTDLLSTTDVASLGRSVGALDDADYLKGGLWRVADVVAATRDCRHHVKKAWVVSLMLLMHYRRRNSAANSDSTSPSVWKALVPVDADGTSAEWGCFLATLLSLGTESFSAAKEPIDEHWSLLEKTVLTQFLTHCFASLDEDFIAASVMKLCSLAMWRALSPSQRQIEFQAHPKLERHWKKLESPVEAQSSTEEGAQPANKRRKVSAARAKKLKKPKESAADASWTFLVHLCDDFLNTINDESAAGQQDEEDARLRYIGHFLALVTDLLSQLPTRRFLLVVLRRRRFLRRARSSAWVRRFLLVDEGKRSADEIAALEKQLALLEAYMAYPIDVHAGSASSDTSDLHERRSARIQDLQQLVFRDFRDSSIERLAIVPVSHIADRDSFTNLLATAVTSAEDGHANVQALAVAVGLAADSDEASALAESDDLVDAFLDEFSTSDVADALLNSSPVFPTEGDIWSSVLGSSDGRQEAGGRVYGASDAHMFPLLPVRKLGLQFLDLADYLHRNYELCRLEAAHGIRLDLEATIQRVDAVRALQNTGDGADTTIFRGFSPLAVPLSAPAQIVKVSKPALGKQCPSLVLARVELELSSRHRSDAFDSYQTREVVYLVTVRATRDEAAEMMGFHDAAKSQEDGGFFPEEFGIIHVRAGELVEVSDGSGTVIASEDQSSRIGGGNVAPRGRARVFKVALDGNQYKQDLESGSLEAYERANLLIRRKSGDNTFKAVLDTLARSWEQNRLVNKSLAQRQSEADEEEDRSSAPAMIPTWLHDLLLGYGDPSSARYPAICKARKGPSHVDVPLFEAIVDGRHAKEVADSIGCKLVDAADTQTEVSPAEAHAPFVYSERVLEDSDSAMGEPKVVIKAQRSASGKQSSANESAVRYTAAQAEAIRSGSCEGLTVVVGPPGTGKTDVAVQLVLNLYRSAPAGEKIVVVAHSSQALDAFFDRLLARQAIHEAGIVRLGQGAKDDQSASGRVAFLLQRRLELLAEVKYMATWVEQRSALSATPSTGLGDSASYSCENAFYFYRMYMKPLVDAALAADALSPDLALLDYHAKRNGTEPAAAGPSLEALRQFATLVDAYFVELARLQPFELLHTARQRADMYLVHHARVLAMTSAHAALDHRRLVDLGLTIGSVVVLEAARLSEADALIPVLLASARSSKAAARSGVSASASLFSGNLKRLVLVGDPQQLPPAVAAHALETFARLDESLFSRLLRLGVPRVVLTHQGRSRAQLADVYRWRYASEGGCASALGDLPRVSALPPFQRANPGFAFVGQLVEVSGAREHQPRPSAFENLEEARFAVALVKYMLAIGYSPSRVTVLATYDAQCELLQRFLQKEAASKSVGVEVSTVDRFQGRQSDVVVLSTVRSGDDVGVLRDARRATTALSRARLGLYVLGRRETLRSSRELAPFLDRLAALAPSHSSGGLALVPSERVGDDSSRPAGGAGGKKAKKDAGMTVAVASAKELAELAEDLAQAKEKASK